MAYLQLKDIKKSFGEVDIIKGVDLEIQKGEFIVFVGPSGCGKSTLLRLIAGLEPITSGNLLLDGNGRLRASATWPWCSRATRSTRT
jgi:multiple sugar transport system ATP-binding protein